jgi:hypothetical protein
MVQWVGVDLGGMLLGVYFGGLALSFHAEGSSACRRLGGVEADLLNGSLSHESYS